MGLLRLLGLGSNLKTGMHYKKKAENASRDSVKGTVKRYYNFGLVVQHLEYYVADLDSSKKANSTDAELEQLRVNIESANNLMKEMRKEESFEDRRLKRHYDVTNTDALLHAKKRIAKYTTAAVVGGTTALAILGAAGLYIKDLVSDYNQSTKARDILIPKVESALRGNLLDEAEKAWKDELDEVRYSLAKKSYPDIYEKTDSLKRDLEILRRLNRAEDKFNEANKLIEGNNYAEAVKLLEGTGGVRSLLTGVQEGLPEYRREKFNDLVKSADVLIEKCSQYKSDSNKFNPIKDEMPKLLERVASLEEVVKKGELFDLVKAQGIVDIVDRYLSDLGGVNPNAVGGSALLDEVKSRLNKVKEAVTGENGLLTKYELIEYNSVKGSLGKVKEVVAGLENTLYIESSALDDVSKLRGLLESVKRDLRHVDSTRVDTFSIVAEISALENTINDANGQVIKVNKLKEQLISKNEDERISAAVELAKRYFERDSREKKWERVSSVLEVIPEMKRDKVEEISWIVDQELKLTKPEGQIFARENGFNQGDLLGYNILTSDYAEKKDDKTARNAVENLLKEADLKEGKDVIRLLDELSGLRKEKEDKEKLGKIRTNAEMEAKRVARLDALSEEIEATEISVKIALEKLRDSAKAYLESGDRIPDPRILSNLALRYGKLGKKEIADEYEAKSMELKKKYKIE